MDKFENLMDSLKEGDMFKSENGNIGIKLYGRFYFSNPIGYGDSIVEVRKNIFNRIIEKKIDLTKLWDTFKEDSVFLGISYQASSEDSNCIRDMLKEQYTNVIEYDPFAPLEYNNKKLVEADLHVIVPPYDFYTTHIIGAGLYAQIIERRKADKNSEVFVSGALFPIEKIYKLAGNDLNKTAVIIY